MAARPGGTPPFDRDPTDAAPPARPLRPSWETAAAPQSAPRPAASGPASAQGAPRPAPAAPPSLPYVPPPAAPAAPMPSLDAPAVSYDLAGNPVPSAAPSPSPYAPPVAYPAQGATWPPAPLSRASGMQTAGDGTDRVSRLKWNWGAFLIPFWWSLFNGQKNIAIFIFVLNGASRAIPAPYDWAVVIAQFGIQVYLGLTGHRLSWESGRFYGDYDQFIRTQRAWMIWGFALAGFIGIGFVLLLALVPGMMSILAGGSQPGPHIRPGGSYGGSGAGTP